MEPDTVVSTQEELFHQGDSAGTRPCRAVIRLMVGALLIMSLCFLTGCSGGGNTGGGDASGVETNGEETPAEEEPVDPREQVLKDYVSTQVEDCGWLESEISYEDNGEGDTVFVYFRPEDMWSQDIQGYDDAMAQDEAYALAKELNSFVYILGYTTDDRLVSTVAAGPPNFFDLDEEAQNYAVKQLTDLHVDYLMFAREEAEGWLNEYASNARGRFEGLKDINVQFDDERSAYIIMYLWEDGYCPVQDDADAEAQWQWEADIISRSTANNIIMLHGTSASGPQATYVAAYANNMLYGYTPV